MRTPIVLLTLGLIIMAIAIAYGFIAGGFLEEARTLFGYPWFHVSLIDLYLGFFLFGGWIIFREQSKAVAIAWIVALCLLGNLASCGYAILALVRSKGDWQQFWIGSKAR